MLIIFWVIALIALSYFFSQWAEKKHNPNQDIGGLETESFREVTLKRNRQGHYVSNGKINGVSVVFMLDTGATVVSVPQNLARKLKLTPGERYKTATANGPVTVRDTRIAKLELGIIHLHDVPASINPGLGGNEILLGMSVLKHLEFTQSGRTLTLRQYPK